MSPRIAATLRAASKTAPEMEGEGAEGDRIALAAMDADAIVKDVVAWHRKAVARRREEVAWR